MRLLRPGSFLHPLDAGNDALLAPCLLDPGRIAVAVLDDHGHRQTRFEEWPAFVAFNPDARGHALHHVSEFPGRHIAWDQREIAVRRRADPQHPATKWFAICVYL